MVFIDAGENTVPGFKLVESSFGSAGVALIIPHKLFYTINGCPTNHLNAFMHVHAHFELIFAVSGEIQVYLEQTTVTVEAGELLCIRPGVYHRTVCAKREGSFRLFQMLLTERQNCRPADAFPVLSAEFSSKPYRVFKPTAAQLRAIEACDTGTDADLTFRQRCEALHGFMKYIELVYFSSPHTAEEPSCALNDAGIRFRMDEFFNMNYFEKDQSISDLAAFIHLSRAQTARFMKRFYGVTFTQHMLNMRMKNAACMLLHDKISVADIADHVGFSSVNYFHSRFREYYGCTPKEYKKRRHTELTASETESSSAY